MRVEPAPPVYRFDDRRRRPDERRAEADQDFTASASSARRAVNQTPHVWFQPAFGAHLLGLVTPERASRASVVRAYSQPESRTPLRPREDIRT